MPFTKWAVKSPDVKPVAFDQYWFELLLTWDEIEPALIAVPTFTDEPVAIPVVDTFPTITTPP